MASGKPGIWPKKSRTNSCRKIDTPMAVISGARRGALRSGR